MIFTLLDSYILLIVSTFVLAIILFNLIIRTEKEVRGERRPPSLKRYGRY